MSIFNFGTKVTLTGGKYLIKIIFDNKIEIPIFEISKRSNFNKLSIFFILRSIWA